MEEFTTTNLQLILGVKEGSHFDRVLKPTVIIATLNGHCLETKKIQPDSNPQFATDLIWDVDKNALRKMRCNQTPIKIECYAVNENGSREKLGYILLGVRCAQIVHHDNEANIKTTWHNILGVRNDFNNCKPQLLLYLIIKEKINKASNVISKEEELPKSIYSDIVPVWLENERLVQLGPLETCHDIFLLNVITETATNLNYLTKDFKELENNNFAFTYNIFDNKIKPKPFKPEMDKLLINEKIVMKIRTSLTVFMNYLYTKPHFLVKLKYKNLTIGQSEVDLRFLVTTGNLQEFRQMNENATSTLDHYCIFKNIHFKESRGDLRKEGAEVDKLPGLKFHIELQSIENKNVINERNFPDYVGSPQLQLHQKDYPKQYNYVERLKSHTNYHSNIPNASSLEKIVHFTEKPMNYKDTFSTNNGSHRSTENICRSKNSHNSYCLNVRLNSIKFFDSRSDVKNIEFRFYHPHGEMISAISKNLPITAEQTIELKDVKCKLHFISPSDEIEQLLNTFSPKINICDATFSEKKCIAQISLDVRRLFTGEKSECHCVTPLIDCNSRKEIGNAEITMILEDHTISALNRIQEGTPETILNNSLAYKIVDELETWKERQKEMFKDELRRKEETHLRLLNEEWQRRRLCLESKLTSSVEQCKALANNLSKTTEDLRSRKIQSLEKETKLIQANEELQWKYERKLRQLQDALQKMQEDFSAKLIGFEEQNKSLISQIELLNKKNYELEKIRRDQSEQIEAHKKASLSEDQTTSLLQQLKNLEAKMDSTKKSKAFFKEQWSKAIKEIHSIKLENQQAIGYQIKSSKTELDNLDLEEILHADSTALTYDQIALNQIQREIDVMHPESNLQFIKNDYMLNSFSDVCLNSERNYIRSDISTNSSSSDEKLNMLIEKRDSLLKNGNFTSEDAVIIKLNEEIRSILMNS